MVSDGADFIVAALNKSNIDQVEVVWFQGFGPYAARKSDGNRESLEDMNGENSQSTCSPYSAT